jgi:hypothetical protein
MLVVEDDLPAFVAHELTLGTYAGRGSVRGDPSKRRVDFLSDAQAATISAYDMDTFAPNGSETLSVGNSSVGDNFVLWGACGYAFRAGGQIVIARSARLATSRYCTSDQCAPPM